MSPLLTIDYVRATVFPEGHAPSVRAVREDMKRRGVDVLRVGRKCFVTQEAVTKYVELITCKKQTPDLSSDPLIEKVPGTLAGRSPSARATAVLPENEQRLVLERIYRDKRAKKNVTA